MSSTTSETVFIGDYIEYQDYDYSFGKGYVMSENEGRFTVIKQKGGEVWCGVKAINKINEEEFFKDFYLYFDEINKISFYKDKFSKSFREFIENQIFNSVKDKIKDVFIFTLNNILSEKIKKNKFTAETWYIYWYIHEVFRRYEPYCLDDTINRCYGASTLIKKFLKENKEFIIEMQFTSDSNLLLYLIDEKILEFKHSLGKISDKEFIKNVIYDRIKKFEKVLILKEKKVDEDLKIRLKMKVGKKIYDTEIFLNELIDTRFVFKNNQKYKGNKYFSCPKKIIIEYNEKWENSKDEKYIKKENKKNIKNNVKVKNNTLIIQDANNKVLYEKYFKYLYFKTFIKGNEYVYIIKDRELININSLKKTYIKYNNHDDSETYFNKQETLLIIVNTFSKGNIEEMIKLIKLYSIEDGKYLGFFEINHNSDISIIYDIDIEFL
jgi:hypothetical protein